jgi:hypothetical protein
MKRKDLLWLTVLKVSVDPTAFGPVARQTSWWEHVVEKALYLMARNKKEKQSCSSLQGHTPSDLRGPTKSHLFKCSTTSQ